MATRPGTNHSLDGKRLLALGDSNPTRRRRKAASDATKASALATLTAAQRRVEAAEHERDAALLAAKAAGVRSPALTLALGGVSRHTVIRRIAAARHAQEAAA